MPINAEFGPMACCFICVYCGKDGLKLVKKKELVAIIFVLVVIGVMCALQFITGGYGNLGFLFQMAFFVVFVLLLVLFLFFDSKLIIYPGLAVVLLGSIVLNSFAFTMNNLDGWKYMLQVVEVDSTVVNHADLQESASKNDVYNYFNTKNYHNYNLVNNSKAATYYSSFLHSQC